jgi:hypothetical protein
LNCMSCSPEIISVDETNLCLESVPIYGYSKKGTRVVKRMKSSKKPKRVTLILAVSSTRGVVSHKIVDGSANTEIF